MPLTRHAYPVLQLAKFWFLTYVYVVDPGAELWPDKIVGLRDRLSNFGTTNTNLFGVHVCDCASHFTGSYDERG